MRVVLVAVWTVCVACAGPVATAGADLPVDAGSASDQAADVPLDTGTSPDQAADVVPDAGTSPDQTTDLQLDAGTSPHQAADAPPDTGTSPDQTADAPPDSVDATPTPFAVHEWATFTVFHAAKSLQHVPGVQRHEEQVPGFVPVRDLGPQAAGAKEVLAEPVLAKVQTAGAWFHGGAGLQVKATVALPQGIVTATWPPAADQGPPPAAVTALAFGKATWTVQLKPLAFDAVLTVAADSLFAPLREVAALRVIDLAPTGKPPIQEGFLFWRALAAFSPPVRLAAAAVENGQFQVTLHNDGDVALPQVWLLHLHAGGGLLQALGPVGPKSSVIKTPTPKETPAYYNEQVQTALATALVGQGLANDEAQALVATFTHNWLKTFGLRIVVLAPAAWGQQWFPTTFVPQPTGHVRVVLGRFELLTAGDEAALVQQVEAAAAKQDLGVLGALGFFAEPKARRALQVVSKEAQAFVQKLVGAAEGVK